MDGSLRDKFTSRLRLYKSFVNQAKFKLDDYYMYLKGLPDVNLQVTEISNSEFRYEMFGLKFKVACEISPTFQTGFLVTHLVTQEPGGRLLLREASRVGFDRQGYAAIDADASLFLFNSTLDFIHSLNDMNVPLVW
jgi:hypothetical protein